MEEDINKTKKKIFIMDFIIRVNLMEREFIFGAMAIITKVNGYKE